MSEAIRQVYHFGNHIVEMHKLEGTLLFKLLPQGPEASSYMWVYQLIPGITVMFHEYNSPHCHVFNDRSIARDIIGDVSSLRRMLEINVCREGTFRVLFPKHQTFVSILQDDLVLTVTTMSDWERALVGSPDIDWVLDLPTSRYRGFGIIIDLALVENQSRDLLTTLGIKITSLVDSYRLTEGAFVMAADLGMDKTIDAIELYWKNNSMALLRLGVLELLARLDARIVPSKSLARSECSLETARLVREARNHAFSQLDSRYTIDEISRRFKMCPTVFKNAFRELYGEPYARYMTRCRMERAEELLVEGQRILSVAQATGYESPSKFSAAFKRAFGESPSEYRERMSAKK
jgi:AraC-like DNA-binding protein